MKFFIDTANLDEIAEAKSWGCLAGVTTNPTLYAKTGGKLEDFEPHMVKIAKLCEGLPVSAESTAETAEDMIAEGRHLASLAPNIVVKLPICPEALAATHTLAAEGVRINMTLIFSEKTVSHNLLTWLRLFKITTGRVRMWMIRLRLFPPLFVRPIM